MRPVPYEKGQWATYDLIWNDHARALTIGARHGSFPGMIQRRDLRLVLIWRPIEGDTNKPPAKSVSYAGKPMKVQF